MTTIENDNHYCTLINVFTVDPSKHQQLFDILKEATETVMCKLPGYVSANLHISDDKKTVTNYAQWASINDFKNMLKNEHAGMHMKRAADLAIEFKPITYSTIWSHSHSFLKNKDVTLVVHYLQ